MCDWNAKQEWRFEVTCYLPPNTIASAPSVEKEMYLGRVLVAMLAGSKTLLVMSFACSAQLS
jgi:hypothetical protein